MDAKHLSDTKSYKQVYEKKEPQTMADIEAQLWKNNVKQGKRKDQDFLDTSKEDFASQKYKAFDGQEQMPSTFNIFRDSLR